MTNLRRSALYVPGTNLRALAKIPDLSSDMVILDLEDSVAPEMKSLARKNLLRSLREGAATGKETLIRVNARGTPFWDEDIALLAECRPDAALLPKISNATEVEEQMAEISSMAPGVAVWLMMETPGSIINAPSIAARRLLDPGLHGFVIGTNDLAKDTSVDMGGNRQYLLPWLMQIIAAAKSHGLDVIDGVFNDVHDHAGFRVEATQGRCMGMSGKSLIHPAQIEPANAIFSPSEDEVSWASRIVEAFDRAKPENPGVITLDGKMVERLHLEQAQVLLERDRLIKSRSAYSGFPS